MSKTWDHTSHVRALPQPALTITMPPATMAKLQVKCAKLGVQRTAFVRGLIERELK